MMKTGLGETDGRSVTLRKPKAERWEQLLDAAADVFFEKGYDAATLQDIAERVGILKGSIYYYIKTKTDLRDSLLAELSQQRLKFIRERAQTEATSIAKLAAMIRGHVEFFCDNVRKNTVYLQEMRRLHEADRTRLLRAGSYRLEFQRVLEQGQEDGSILPQLEPEMASRAMLSALNALYQWYTPRFPPAQVADHFITTILRGHATEAGLAAFSALPGPGRTSA
jgi:AcrR family transcriptional regulator